MTLHHVGIAVESIAAAAEQYGRALGITLSTEIIEDEIQRVRVAFALVAPGVFVEFVEPLDAESPISRVLKSGGGIYHLCYTVPDLESAVTKVCEAGGRKVSGPSPARAFAGRRLAWVYTANRTLVELVEEEALA